MDADWAISSKGIRVLPDRPGYLLQVPQSAKILLRAALVTTPELRSAKLVVKRSEAERTTDEARAMRIQGLVAAYQTFYGGDPNRIHNVQLVSHLVDKHVIAPGETFSFNGATGARTADKGFREAPVIINGELQTGLGGGVCQVSTTVFNAAYEAGLPIASRTNHALYISHYPQGRDATVNYPDVDLKFVNDTAALAAPPDLGRPVVAHRCAVRHAGTPACRQRDAATGRDRAGSRREGSGLVDAGRPAGHRRKRRAVTFHQRPPQGLRREGKASLRCDLLLVLPRRARGDPVRDQAAAETEAGRAHHDDEHDDHDHHDPDYDDDSETAEDDDLFDDDPSALAIAAASPAGIRVGRSVFASTQACDVQPSAIISPSRSTR